MKNEGSQVQLIAFRALLRKEIKLLVRSPVTYGVVGVYTIFYFLLVYVYIFLSGQIAFKPITEAYLLLSLFLNVLLAAPVVAREERRGTLEWLLGAPLEEAFIIMAKYSTLMFCYGVSILLTMPVYIYLSTLTSIPVAEWVLHYVVLVLFGGSTLALGVLCSTVAKREATAAILGLSFALLAVFLNGSLAFFPKLWREILGFLILLPRSQPFIAGVFDLGASVYYVIYTLCCLVLSVYVLKRKRWD